MTPALIRWNLYREVVMNEKYGTFYALSVGPGDPELMTVKACRCLERCPVIAAPQTKSGQMLALDIARGAVSLDGKEILPLRFTMSRDASVRQESYRAAAQQIEEKLAAARQCNAALRSKIQAMGRTPQKRLRLRPQTRTGETESLSCR